ncbi:MAG: proprotein convertase P-domain-containing protein, partial [Planctomycetota bacterium]
VQSQFGSSNALPINNFFQAESTIDVSGASLLAGDLEIGVNIDYNGVESLSVELIAPSGTTVVLVDTGISGSDMVGTVFDDDADTAIGDGASPYTGSFRPQQPLSDLDGIDPNGTWTLRVQTSNFAVDGTLTSWFIRLGTAETQVQTDVNGYYAFFDLPAGDYPIAVTPAADWEFTGAASQTVSLNASTLNQNDVNFGVAQSDHAYLFAFDDADGDGLLGVGEMPMEDATFFIDANDNGMPDLSDEVVAGNTPIDFVDVGTVIDPVEVSGMEIGITDINFRFDAVHTYTSDVRITLVAPDGTSAVLINRVGGGGDNFLGTVLDDDADIPLAAGFAPFAGTFRPSEPLSIFNGLDPNGTWELIIDDLGGGDLGIVNHWSMEIQSGETTFQTDAHGWVIDAIAVAEEVDYGFVAPAGFQHTVPVDGMRTVTGDGTALTGLTFGAREAAVSEVFDIRLFYNNATGANLSSDGDAQSAIDFSKTALLPGESSTFANYSSYLQGLNGIVVDMDGLPESTDEAALVGVFEFEVWDGIDTGGWADLDTAIVPSFEIFRGSGLDESDRIKITFDDGELTNTWLQTRILAGAVSGLESDTVFAFGNVVGDTGFGNTSSRIRVNAIDTIQYRLNQSVAPNSAAVDNVFDLNRDGRVNAIDTILTRLNQSPAGSVAPITLAGSASRSFGGSGDDDGGRGDDLKDDDSGTKDLIFGSGDDFRM